MEISSNLSNSRKQGYLYIKKDSRMFSNSYKRWLLLDQETIKYYKDDSVSKLIL